jgi:hypothetical protein
MPFVIHPSSPGDSTHSSGSIAGRFRWLGFPYVSMGAYGHLLLRAKAQGQKLMEGNDQGVENVSEGKIKGRRVAKPKSPERTNGKRSLNLSIPTEDHERLAIHALRRNLTISEIVSQLAREHLREFHITTTPQRNGKGPENFS